MAKRTMRKKTKGGVNWLAPKNRPMLPALRARSTRVGDKKSMKRHKKRSHRRGGSLVSNTQQDFNTAGRDVSSAAHSVGRTTTSAVKTVGRDTGNLFNTGLSTLTGAINNVGSFLGKQTRKAKGAVGLNGGKKYRRKKSRKYRRSKKSRKYRRSKKR
ncbi:hypothetical protein ceV_426 [Chrysochromulina ericina virus CeV-01B]|uniref:Uncharacterized protein n=1 Tax=Chrysochromulina ericina virus CeV-01B TaxID=3070830 RepID=A0A0N9Q9M9_9VIRU|nr:hypothetical protein ceV_426 [Chrysochromulina ericina virus]ALH23332.1 hypothetical protein ceV_426 [Chrysochromulina ericina virus CeV-01B]